jgi:hypothetical protein
MRCERAREGTLEMERKERKESRGAGWQTRAGWQKGLGFRV